MTDDNTLELQVGHAHGVRDGDQFAMRALDPAEVDPRPQQFAGMSKVIQTRALTSDLEPLDLPSIRDGTGWMAHPITRLSLRRFPVRLPPNMPHCGVLGRFIGVRMKR